ncbi:hypothetical protein CPS_1925 [Colwellia psychrerythraea 34H]|uniref:Uncharacterized protein n=1 Tax=Colwellia psychrerythraea (strain 34H / ATCC BAA-681) TaxID=167879 RepID=Q483W1_COLP3|nr:hypothetical protein CPS_1925 [Colwellia psychrerythraea 34H]
MKSITKQPLHNKDLHYNKLKNTNLIIVMLKYE